MVWVKLLDSLGEKDREAIIGPQIGKVRGNLFQISECKKEPLNLPEPDGPMMTLSEKVYVPVKEHPDVS
ncbi:unnamed protein product, partial [Notodromas monacha]